MSIRPETVRVERDSASLSLSTNYRSFSVARHVINDLLSCRKRRAVDELSISCRGVPLDGAAVPRYVTLRWVSAATKLKRTENASVMMISGRSACASASVGNAIEQTTPPHSAFLFSGRQIQQSSNSLENRPTYASGYYGITSLTISSILFYMYNK